MDREQMAQKFRIKRFMKMLNKAKSDPDSFGMSWPEVEQFEANMKKMVADYRRRYGAS
ncbi:hypothetical protein [uncultured Anaerococcus sp.]|uniref:hypothetical protein n=1 Tax=uncultured Anaerococcus sp. TaxID=293428 RepID=UPI0025D14DB8|nr:hypothetical protein [uncultured Anaerococcus sp.]